MALLSFFRALLVYGLLLPLLSFFSRLQRNVDALRKSDRETVLPGIDELAETDVREVGNPIISNRDRKGIPDIRLKFRFPTLEEFSRIQKGSGNFLVVPKYKLSSVGSPVSALIGLQEDVFPVTEINLNKTGVNGEAKEFIDESGKEGEEFLDETLCCSDKKSDRFLSGGEFGEELITDCCKNENSRLEFVSGFGENQGLPEHLGDAFLSEDDFNDQRNGTEFVKASDSGDSNRMETLWEHQELIEQLKMELRKVRATGLPTILEESESPRLIEELKPWKIDEGLWYEDCMDEVNRLCKCYREMMRRFDILNYQKMFSPTKGSIPTCVT